MSNLKDRIIQKMQAGGGLSIRGEYQGTPTKIYHDPNKAGQQAQSRGPQGGYAKKPAAKSSGKYDPLYRSHEIMKEQVKMQQNQLLTQIEADPNFSPEEKDAKMAQVMHAAQMETKRINEEGTQFKDSLDQFNAPGSRGKEIAHEYVIRPGSNKLNPSFLTQYVDENGSRQYAFVSMAEAYQSKGQLTPMRVQQSISYAKQDPSFIRFLQKNNISDLAALLVGTVSHNQIEKDAVEFFNTISIDTERAGTDFTLTMGEGENAKKYDSASLTAKNSAGANLLTQKYMATLSDQDVARYHVQAYNDGTNFMEYMNQFVLSRAGIDYIDEDTEGSGKNKHEAPTSAADPFLRSTSVEVVDLTIPIPSKEMSDEFTNMDKISSVSARQMNTIQNAGGLIAGEGARSKAASLDTIQIGNTDFFGSLALDGTRNAKFRTNLSTLEDVLVGNVGMEKETATQSVITTGVKTNSGYPIKATFGVGFSSENGASSGDLERMMMVITELIRGGDYTQGGLPASGLLYEWTKHLEMPTEEEFLKDNSAVSAMYEIYLEGAQEELDAAGNVVKTKEEVAKEKYDFLVQSKMQERAEGLTDKGRKIAQKKFEEEIINGDALISYFKRRNYPNPEAIATKYKEMLKQEYSIIPQVSFTGQIVFTNDSDAEALGDLGGYTGGTVTTDFSEIQAANIASIHGLDPEEVEGIWVGPMLIDVNLNADALKTTAKFVYGETFDGTSKKGKEQVDHLAQLFGKHRKLNLVDNYIDMPWLNVK